MPLVALIPVIMAGSAIVTTGLTVMTAIAAVGAVAGAVGYFTGNKDMQRIGGLAAVAGSVGAYAQNQGWIGQDSAKGGADNISSAIQSESPVAADVNASYAANANRSQTPQSPGVLNDQGAKVLTTPPPPSAGVLASIGEFMKNNKEITSIGLNLVGGMFDDKKKAEADMAGAHANLYNAQANQLNSQVRNASAVPDMSSLRVNPNANVYNTPPAPRYQGPTVGLLNRK